MGTCDPKSDTIADMNSDASLNAVTIPVRRLNKRAIIFGSTFLGLALICLIFMPVGPNISGSVGSFEQDYVKAWVVSVLTVISTIAWFVGVFVLLFKLLPPRLQFTRDLISLVVAYLLTGYWYLFCIAASNGANIFTAIFEIVIKGFFAMFNYAILWPIGLVRMFV